MEQSVIGTKDSFSYTVDRFLAIIRRNDLDTKKKINPEGERKTRRKREEAVKMKTQRGSV